jgi:hypothetical protein
MALGEDVCLLNGKARENAKVHQGERLSNWNKADKIVCMIKGKARGH